MIGTMRPVHSHLPDETAEKDHKEKKEDPHDLKPDNASDAMKGSQKSPNPPGDASGRFPCNLSCCTALLGAYRSIRALSGSCWLAGSSLCAGRYPLAGNASGDAKADPKRATNGLGFHSDFDGNSVPMRPTFARLPRVAVCSPAALEVRYRNCSQPPALFSMGAGRRS